MLVPLKAVEEEAYQVRNRSGQDPLNYPIKLNNKIAALAGVIESADNKPTDQSVEVFNELSAQLDAQLAKMKDTLSKQLPLLNAALKREKLDAVDPKAKPAAAGRAEAETVERTSGSACYCSGETALTSSRRAGGTAAPPSASTRSGCEAGGATSASRRTPGAPR